MAATETELKIPDLLTKMTDACTEAAKHLHTTMQGTGMPHHYVIPKMSLKLQLEMSVSQGVIKGIFKKTTTSSKAEALSTIALDIVAVPKQEET